MLVGGQGSRLRPLTIATPKPLLPTAGVPFLAHQLARAREAGAGHVVFATSYRAAMFERAFGDGAAYGLCIDYMVEDEPLGTGGAIRNAAGALRGGPDDPVLVLNGDILSGHDIRAQLALHARAEAAVTLHLTEVTDPSRFGCVPTDADGRVTAFLEKTPDPVTNRINAGCYVFRRSTLDAIPAGQVVSVERETFPGLIAAGETVMGYADAAYWLDVGTPEAYVQGCRDLVLGRLPAPAVSGVPAPALIAADAKIDPDATVGGGSTVGPGATVAAGAEVTGSVLFEDAAVGEGARVVDSVLGRGARLAPGVILDGAVIGDDAVIEEGNELRAGARLWPGTHLPPTTLRFTPDP
ncbi:MAG: NTP transferase domain-containing protein [Streptosporangiales bacterium]|nr:NTP transferase domain-containing protein [Streptosporangiales bacterium]